VSQRRARGTAFRVDRSAAVNLPEALRLVVQGQEAIARVVAFAAAWAGNKAAEMGSAPIKVFGHRKAGPATAGNQKKTKILWV